MAQLIEHLPLLRSLWVVWFFVLFILMLWLVLRPSKKRYFESQADIPLRDEPGHAHASPGERPARGPR